MMENEEGMRDGDDVEEEDKIGGKEERINIEDGRRDGAG